MQDNGVISSFASIYEDIDYLENHRFKMPPEEEKKAYKEIKEKILSTVRKMNPKDRVQFLNSLPSAIREQLPRELPKQDPQNERVKYFGTVQDMTLRNSNRRKRREKKN